MAAHQKRRKHLLFDSNAFPALKNSNHQVTSDPDDNYNCIAYAAGDQSHIWWPRAKPQDLPAGWLYEYSPLFYWPPGCPEVETVEAFIAAFSSIGYSVCDDKDDGKLEHECEKIAIYARQVGDKEIPTHAAKQSPTRNGKWRSKMGSDGYRARPERVARSRLWACSKVYAKAEKYDKEDVSLISACDHPH